MVRQNQRFPNSSNKKKKNNNKNKGKKNKNKTNKNKINSVGSNIVRKINANTLTLTKRELWTTFDFETDAITTPARISFDGTTGPAWFKKFSSLYENYNLHAVKLIFVPLAATTNSGGYVASYNTNKAQLGDARTYAQLAAQKGAKTAQIYEPCTVFIPASALKNFRTNTPCVGNDSWSFNVEILHGNLGQACSLELSIEYCVTFRNPQI